MSWLRDLSFFCSAALSTPGWGGSCQNQYAARGRGKKAWKGIHLPRTSLGPKQHVSFLLTFHWLTLSHIARPKGRGDRGVRSSSVMVTVTNEEEEEEASRRSRGRWGRGGGEKESGFLVTNKPSLPQSQFSRMTQFDSLLCLFP